MLGAKIREYRNIQKLSLRELGESTGLTAAFLSQVENDLTSPSISSLQKIAVALHVPMFAFLDGDVQTEEVVHEDSRKKLNFPEHDLSYEMLTQSTQHKIGAFLIHLKAGDTNKTQKLYSPTEEIMYVIQGEMEIWLGERRHFLKKGDSVFYEGAQLKGFSAIGTDDLIVLCAITPPVL
jgi:transcriptional regulator with XRE-family HTH domain